MKQIRILTLPLLAAICACGSARADITSNLVAHWALDETGGTNAVDSSGNANQGDLHNFTANFSPWVPGRVGGALNFNGDVVAHDSYVLTPPLNFPTDFDSFTFCFWIKRVGGPPGAVNEGSYPRVIAPLNTSLWVLYGQGKGVGFFPLTLANEPVIGQWEHYVVVYDRANQVWSVFLNGQPTIAANIPSQVANAAPGVAQWIIGHNESPAQPGDFWYGELDDVRIYNRLFTPEDALELFHSFPRQSPYAPVILQQPQGGQTNSQFVGKSLNLYALADGYDTNGSSVVSYQWQKGVTNIPGANGLTLTLNNLQRTDSGVYTLVASNSLGTATTLPTFLQVSEAPILPDYTNGLIAHWTFDETTGTNAVDSSGNSNSVSLFNFPEDNSQWVTGRVGGALRWNLLADASQDPVHDDYLLTDQNLIFTNNQDQFTFCFWIKLEYPAAQSGSFPRLFAINNLTHWILFGGSAAVAGVGMYPTLPAIPQPQVGAWEHYAVVFNRVNATYDVYRNGVPAAQGLAASRSQPGGAAWIIGHNESPGQPGDEFFGEMDDLRIYNRLLLANDIYALYQAAPAVPPSFVQQPQGTYYKLVGQPFSLSVQAQGNELTYAWQKGSQNIPGETNSTLNFASLQLTNVGSYSVMVSNIMGTTNSSPATLQVQSPNAGGQSDYGLIANWQFDETSGLVAADASGRTNNASLINYDGDDSQWVTGRIGGALSFNLPGGAPDLAVHDDYVVTDNPIVFDNQDEFSFSFWINRTVTNAGTFPRAITPYGQTHWVLWGQGTGVGFYPPVPGLPDPGVGVWDHYVVVFNRGVGSYSVYLNGNPAKSNVPISRSAPGATPWIMGHNENPAQSADHWFGALDNVRIYNRLLTAADVNALAQLGGIVRLTIALAGQSVVITWPGLGTLESANQVTGSWTNVAGAPTSPFTITPSAASQFFRVRQ